MSRLLTLNTEWLKKHVRGVVQVGMGSSPIEIDTWVGAGIKHQVYIEPYPPYFETTLRLVKQKVPNTTTVWCFPYALLNKDKVVTLNLNSQKDSHSVLEMDESRPKVVEWMVTVDKVDVEGKTLNSVFQENELDGANYNLLFMDTQCSEHLIIEGASNVLKFFDYVEIEIATKSVYKGSLLFDDFVALMDKQGYSVLDTESLIVDGEELAKDVTFIKNELQGE